MVETSQLVATFILNALWQITAITALALFCTKLLHRAPSRFSHAVWIAALGACLLIPAATVVLQPRDGTGRASEAPPAAQPDSATEPSAGGVPVSFRSLSRSVSFSPRILYALFWGYGIALTFRAARLAWFGYQTRILCRLAYPRPLPPALARILEQCQRSFSLPCVSVLCTAELSGPATLGFTRPLLLLPETFFLEGFPDDDLFSAISHELAHALRRDFLFNLLYEIASLPLCFHPCVALILSRIEQTRELVCDEIAVQMLPTTGRYATSLLHIAQSMFPGARSNYALGLFDTNTLEERIMNILKNNDMCRKARPIRLIAVCLIGAASIGLSAFSLRLNTSHSEDLTPFVGTWEAKYQGTTFFALHLKLENGSLGGTCDYGERLTLVNGELIPDGSKLSSHKIVETKLSGKKLLLKLEGNESSSTFPLEFALTGADQAEGRIVVASDSGTPPPKKPWHFVRVASTSML
jgi:beta-lactamase regulating signal transducer with metallopeptidase domain